MVHLAASHVVPDSVNDPGKYYKNNVSGTQALLDMCVKAGVKNFIFSGSSSVYGERETKEPFTEDLVPNPMSPYAMTKYMTELMLEDYHKAYGLNYVSTRYFNAAGADPEGLNGYTQEQIYTRYWILSGETLTHLVMTMIQQMVQMLETTPHTRYSRC